ncbi:MAG: cytochrome c [Proteobacteria bacterium]|nr:cytochrome c [Pseudomonadota bacterium]MDA0993267.1 cytochrome c [Pseudomonadota bacterium]
MNLDPFHATFGYDCYHFRPHDLAAPSRSRGTIINNRLIFGTLFVSFFFYSAYVYTVGTEAAHVPPMSDEARRGQQVFQKYNCIACHQFYGLGGYMGPDLTNVISNRGEAYAGAFIAAGTASMPNLGLSPDETSDVVSYLGFVDTTGTYPPKNYEVTWFGWVTQEDDPQ